VVHQLFNFFLLKLVKSVHLVIQTFPSISDFHKTNNFLVVIDWTLWRENVHVLFTGCIMEPNICVLISTKGILSHSTVYIHVRVPEYISVITFCFNSTLYQNAVFWLVDERGIFFFYQFFVFSVFPPLPGYLPKNIPLETKSLL
jgi:hypothetical protein